MIETIFNQAEVTRREIAAAEKRGKLELVRELVKSGKLSLEEIASLAHLPLHEIEKLA